MKLHKLTVLALYIIGIGFVFGAPESPLLMALPKEAKDRVFAGKADLGSTSLRVNKQCAELTAHLEDEFLKKLRREATSAGPRFTKDGKTVTHLPEKINVSITGLGTPCYSKDDNPPMPVPGFRDDVGNDLMKSLRFSAKWLRPGTAQSLPVKIETFPPMWQEHDWAYRLTVDTAGMPIDAPIEIDVFASSGEDGVLSSIIGSLAQDPSFQNERTNSQAHSAPTPK